MDFSLNDDQRALRDLAREVLSDWAAADRWSAIERSAEGWDGRLWRDLAGAGLLGVAIPERLGGLGLGLLDLAIVCAEQGRVVAPIPYVWTSAAALVLATHGSNAQQSRWLPGILAGDLVVTSSLPQCGSVELADGRMSGTVVGVPYGDVARVVLVPTADGRLHAVDLASAGVSRATGRMTNREPCAELRFDRVVAEPVGTGATGRWHHERTIVCLAAVQSGVTEAALAATAVYTSARHQFGKPLSSFQGVALKAADGYIDHAAIAATMLQAGWWLERRDSAPEHVLTAAWWAAEAGQHCVHLTQHLHGGIGADVTYPVHRYFLWGKQTELYLGASSDLLGQLGDLLASAPGLGDGLDIGD